MMEPGAHSFSTSAGLGYSLGSGTAPLPAPMHGARVEQQPHYQQHRASGGQFERSASRCHAHYACGQRQQQQQEQPHQATLCKVQPSVAYAVGSATAAMPVTALKAPCRTGLLLHAAQYQLQQQYHAACGPGHASSHRAAEGQGQSYIQPLQPIAHPATAFRFRSSNASLPETVAAPIAPYSVGANAESMHHSHAPHYFQQPLQWEEEEREGAEGDDVELEPVGTSGDYVIHQHSAMGSAALPCRRVRPSAAKRRRMRARLEREAAAAAVAAAAATGGCDVAIVDYQWHLQHPQQHIQQGWQHDSQYQSPHAALTHLHHPHASGSAPAYLFGAAPVVATPASLGYGAIRVCP
jgi:hypothetical protein